MATTNLTGGGTQTETYTELVCSPTLVGGIQQYSISLSALHIFLSVTAFFHGECSYPSCPSQGIASLHPPSKLLYRCLAITELCVGLVVHPLAATYRMSLVHEDWSLCRYAYGTRFTTSYALCSVSLVTLTAISVDRLLALLLRLRYRQVVTLKRTHMIVAIFWLVSGVAALSYIFDPGISRWCGYIGTSSCLVTSIASYTKIFRALNNHHGQEQDHVQQPSQPNALHKGWPSRTTL